MAVMFAVLALAFPPLDFARGKQDLVQGQVDEYLRQFQAAAQVEQALALLSARFAALGDPATGPIARRLAEDLRVGTASAAAPAMIDALVGRPDAWAPLQAAFRDVATPAAGRVELARALLELEDGASWREGILAIALDAKNALGVRLHAAAVLLDADDRRVLEEVRRIVDRLPDRPEGEQRLVLDFLAEANTPETRGLLAEAMSDPMLAPEVRLSAAEALGRLGDVRRAGEIRRALARLRSGGGETARRAEALEGRLGRWSDEPRATVIDEARRPIRASAAPRRPSPKKRETEADSSYTMRTIVAGTVAAGLLVFVLAFKRKG